MKRYKFPHGYGTLVKNKNVSPTSFGHEWQKAEELVQGLPEKLDHFYTSQGEYQQNDTEDICRVNLLLKEVHRLLDGIHARH